MLTTNIEKTDLDTVEYYFVACMNCGKTTPDVADWADAIHDAKEHGFQVDDGVIYCRTCAEIEARRQAEETESIDEYRTRLDGELSSVLGFDVNLFPDLQI